MRVFRVPQYALGVVTDRRRSWLRFIRFAEIETICGELRETSPAGCSFSLRTAARHALAARSRRRWRRQWGEERRRREASVMAAFVAGWVGIVVFGFEAGDRNLLDLNPDQLFDLDQILDFTCRDQ